MNFIKTYNRAFIYAIIFTVVVTIAAAFAYASLSKWQESLVEKNKLVCQQYAMKLYDFAIHDINIIGASGRLESQDLSSLEIKQIDTTLKMLSYETLKVMAGLEGGFYLINPDEFYGYSFPTSPPPVPVYGPPPRSYNIIKQQSLQSIEENRMITDLHSFNAAVFPLATKPIIYNSKAVGVVWVRIHIENELPIIKLKQVVNVVAFIAILGFLILTLVSSFFSGEIKGIKKEMGNIRSNASFRLRKRWGIFGYISANINEMLTSIEQENNQRLILEQKLNQKEKLASLGIMVAGVAHEVKTPLAIIKTRIQMWQQEVKRNPDIAQHISPDSMQMVINETNRLSTLVKRLLIFSRPIEEKMKESDIIKLIDEVLGFFNVDKANSIIKIVHNHDSRIPLIRIDENSIKQLIINVLDNSFEAMPSGGTITINSHADNKNRWFIIDISDNGSGIPEEMLDKIFDPFFTLKDSGVGLGLSISYQIVKAHNGEISFMNNPDKGTKCTIKLPLN